MSAAGELVDRSTSLCDSEIGERAAFVDNLAPDQSEIRAPGIIVGPWDLPKRQLTTATKWRGEGRQLCVHPGQIQHGRDLADAGDRPE